MAGRPKLRDLTNKIDDLGGIEWFCGEIENGKTITKLAKELDVSPYLVYSYLKKGNNKEQFEESRRRSAHTMVDESRDLIDDATCDNIAVRREQAKNRQWCAEKFNREAYGQTTQPAVQVNIGALHLNAMKEAREIEDAKAQDVTKLLPSDSRGEEVEITNVSVPETAVDGPSSEDLD